jgi:hypothetical protein
MNTGSGKTSKVTGRSFPQSRVTLVLPSPDLSNHKGPAKKFRGFTPRLHFQVNTLDETSRIQQNAGTNYTICPRLPGWWMIGSIRFPQHLECFGGFF